AERGPQRDQEKRFSMERYPFWLRRKQESNDGADGDELRKADCSAETPGEAMGIQKAETDKDEHPKRRSANGNDRADCYGRDEEKVSHGPVGAPDVTGGRRWPTACSASLQGQKASVATVTTVARRPDVWGPPRPVLRRPS